jgi:hypothetical protein
MQIAWLLIVPVFYGMDEVDHAYRTSSVVEGYLAPGTEVPIDGRGHLVPVPEHIVDASHDICSELTYIGRDNCVPRDPADEDGLVRVATAAATYNPTYYLVVGFVSSPFEGSHALMAMRVATTLICDALLLWALGLMLRATRTRWPLVALALVCTPVFLYSTTSAAPNAVGFCGAVLLWTALMSLPDRGGPRPVPEAAAVVAGSACVMATHSTGVMWVALILVCGLPLWAPRLKHLCRHHLRAAVAAGALITTSACMCALWLLVADTNDPRTEDAGLGDAPPQLLAHMPVVWVLQGISTLRFRDQAAPMPVYFIAVAAMGWFVLVAFRKGTRRSRLVILSTFGVAIVVPVVATWYAYPYVGNAWQGRYGAPLYVGIFVVAAFAKGLRTDPSLRVGVLTGCAFAGMNGMTLFGMLDYFVGEGIIDGWQVWRVVALVLCSLVAVPLWLAAFARTGVPRD